MCLEFGEGHFDWIEVWAVGRQEEEPCASAAKDFFGFLAFVGGEVVEDDDVAGPKLWSELGFDIGVEDQPVHGRIDNPRGDEALAAQPGNQGLGAPMAERRLGSQPLAFQKPSAQPDHFGVGAGFIEEDQPALLFSHERLAAFDPFAPRLDNVRPVLFRCQKAFF